MIHICCLYKWAQQPFYFNGDRRRQQWLFSCKWMKRVCNHRSFICTQIWIIILNWPILQTGIFYFSLFSYATDCCQYLKINTSIQALNFDDLDPSKWKPLFIWFLLRKSSITSKALTENCSEILVKQWYLSRFLRQQTLVYQFAYVHKFNYEAIWYLADIHFCGFLIKKISEPSTGYKRYIQYRPVRREAPQNIDLRGFSFSLLPAWNPLISLGEAKNAYRRQPVTFVVSGK